MYFCETKLSLKTLHRKANIVVIRECHLMKIFVAKLGFYTKAEDLVALFSKFGKVESAKVIMDRDTNRSKCYGFVEMPNDAEAYKTIVELNECIFQGSVIDVKKSKLEQVVYTI